MFQKILSAVHSIAKNIYGVSIRMEQHNSKSAVLVAFGIPSHDFNFLVPDKKIVQQYNLELDSQKETTRDLLHKIRNDLQSKKFQMKHLSGGNCVNTSVVFTQLLREKYAAVIFGAVGQDEHGKFVERCINDAGVATRFVEIDNKRTAECVIVTNEECRSIAVTNGAGEQFNMSHFSRYIGHEQETISKCKIVLLEGFFVCFSNDITKHIINVSKKNRKTIVVAISGTYIFNKYAKEMLQCVKTANILIGNQNEFNTLCHHLQLKGDIVSRICKCHEIMSHDSESLPCMNKYKKIIIVTNGHLPIYYACGCGQTTNVAMFNVPPITSPLDTTGAGDSFLGAFLYGLKRNMTIVECLEMACEIVASVITSHGYSIPSIPNNSL